MKRFSLLFVASALLFTSNAQASGSAPDGYITTIAVDSGGNVLFDYSGTRSAPPSCQVQYSPTRYAFDGNNTAGQARLADIMTAYALHKHLQLGGLGNCDYYTGVETLNYVIVQD